MRALRILALLTVLVVLALIALSFVSIDSLRGPIAQALAPALGRNVIIEGEINLELDLDPDLEIGGVIISDEDESARIDRIELEFDIRRLAAREFDIRKIRLLGGEIEIAASATNPPPPPTTAEETNEGTAIQFNVRSVEIRDLRVAHHNEAGLVTDVNISSFRADAIDRDQPIRLEVSGDMEGLDFELTGEFGSVAALAANGMAYPVALEGQVEQMDFEAVGTVDRPLDLESFAIDLSLGAPHMAAIAGLADLELPEIGPIDIRAELTDRDGTVGIEGIVVMVGDAEDALRASAKGKLDDIDRLDEIEAELELQARDLALIGELFGLELPYVPAVSMVGRFRGSDEAIRAQNFTVRLDKTNLRGSFDGSFVPGQRPQLSGSLEADLLYLDDVGIERSPDAPRRSPEREGQGQSVLDLPLPVDFLPDMDASLRLRADRVSGRAGLMIDEFATTLVVAPREIALQDIEVLFEGGQLTGEARIDARPDAPLMSLQSTAHGVRLHTVAAQFEEEPSISGLIDYSINLSSRGVTLRDLKGNLDGDLRILVREGSARAKYAHILERDLLRAAMKHGPEEPFEELRCLLGDFQVESGVTEVQTLWFETERSVIFAEGKIDLASESFDLQLRPRPKKRSLIGVAADVHVTGPLDDPSLEISKTSLATSALKGFFSGIARSFDPVLRSWRQQGGGEGPCADALAKAGR